MIRQNSLCVITVLYHYCTARKYSDYSVLEQDLDADTAECMYAELESYCVLEIVFSNNAVCPGVKDGDLGEL